MLSHSDLTPLGPAISSSLTCRRLSYFARELGQLRHSSMPGAPAPQEEAATALPLNQSERASRESLSQLA